MWNENYNSNRFGWYICALVILSAGASYAGLRAVPAFMGSGVFLLAIVLLVEWRKQGWRFSVYNLLAATTLIAVLLVLWVWLAR